MSTVNIDNSSKTIVEKPRLTIQNLKIASLIPMAVCAAILLWLYTPTFKWWYVVWMADESYYSHGILVPAISAFIIWLKRKQISDISISPNSLGYFIVVPALVISLAMIWAGGSAIQGLLFPAILFGIILILFGIKMAKELLFPIGYLYFMCVLPGDVLTKLSFKIQMLSTVVATYILKAMSFDAHREGALITLPNIDVFVGAPCSGFRLLISLFALAVLFVFLINGPKWGKAVLIVSTLPLSILLNAIRITMIALVGEFMGSEAMHKFHDYSGYIMLVLAFFILYLFARLVKCREFNSMLMS